MDFLDIFALIVLAILIAVVICETRGRSIVIDTWLMSCRVLKRGVEDEVLNEILRQARLRGCETVVGHYLPTKRNAMVRELYPSMGFTLACQEAERFEYRADMAALESRRSQIAIERRVHEES